MMWTFKNLVAIGLFLFGSTFLWMTPAFAGRTSPPTGLAWTLVNILALAAVAGFTIAAWAVFKQYSWWGPMTLVSAIIGLAAVIPFILGLLQIGVGFADLGVQINLWMHLVGSAAAGTVVLLPNVHTWVVHHL
jgi:hypothetical protein